MSLNVIYSMLQYKNDDTACIMNCFYSDIEAKAVGI